MKLNKNLLVYSILVHVKLERRKNDRGKKRKQLKWNDIK